MRTKRSMLTALYDMFIDCQALTISLERGFGRITHQLTQQLAQMERRIMDKLDTALADIDKATNDAADRVIALIATFQTITPEQQAEVTKIETNLRAIGTNPNQPAPPIAPSTLPPA